MTLFRFIRADFLKLRHTSVLWIHIAVPVIGVVMFLAYYSFSGWITISKVEGYVQALSIAFPSLIGIISAIVIEQEASAGHFQELLMERDKKKKFFSKVCMLLILAFGSVSIAIGGFAIGFQYVLQQNEFSGGFYYKMILILFLSQIFLYLLHMLCCLRFGTGASVGLGIAESLLAALMLTGLGDGIWRWVPCGWSGRFCGYYILKTVLIVDNSTGVYDVIRENIDLIKKEFQSGVFICLIMTVLLLAFSFLWFQRFEGRNEI